MQVTARIEMKTGGLVKMTGVSTVVTDLIPSSRVHKLTLEGDKGTPYLRWASGTAVFRDGSGVERRTDGISVEEAIDLFDCLVRRVNEERAEASVVALTEQEEL